MPVPRLLKKLSFHKLRSKSVDDLHEDDWAFFPESPLPPVPQIPINPRSQTEPRLNVRQGSSSSSNSGTNLTGPSSRAFTNSRSSTLVSSGSSAGTPYTYTRHSENLDLLKYHAGDRGYAENGDLEGPITPMPGFKAQRAVISSSPAAMDYFPSAEYVAAGTAVTALAVTEFRVEESETEGQRHDRGLTSGNPSREIGTGQLHYQHHESKSIIGNSWDMVKDGSKGMGGAEAMLNTIDDTVSKLQAGNSALTPLITTVETALKDTGVVDMVQSGLDHFFDGMPVFMNALDSVAKLHPFIGVAVMAFKAVYTLELKRRENEKKIIALYVEMKDMMGVLLQLQNVHDEQSVAPDGRSIEDRMSALVNKTADDIKACSNACDTYSKKRLLAKVFQGPMWDTKLVAFAGSFTKRRTEFEFALSVHTALGVDQLNSKVSSVMDTTHMMNQKMDRMMQMFQTLVNPEMKKLAAAVEERGGIQACMENESALRELSGFTSKPPSAGKTRLDPAATRGGKRARDENTSAFEELKADIYDDPDAAIEKNMVVFSRKFEIQKQQIVAELTLVVQHEGDRVIEAVTSGPHDRILDPDMHVIWKDMGWRGNVKARHFVLALRDFFQEKVAAVSKGVVTPEAGLKSADSWAIKYIDIIRLQPIMEAFDDDASGFITVLEMNNFTTSRPKGWSLPHWVAYWAIGHRAAMVHYKILIEELFAKMEGIIPELRLENRGSAHDYFAMSWKAVHTLTAGLDDHAPDPNQERFQTYVESEEKRVKANLEAVDYIIDGLDTLSLVTGAGRIEKSLFILVYLLLKHHFEIMRVARTKVIDDDELWSAEQTIRYIMQAVGYRVSDLTHNFRQQKVDVQKSFANFACGIYKFVEDPGELWSPEKVRSMNEPVQVYRDADEDQTIQPSDILKLEYHEKLYLDQWVYSDNLYPTIPWTSGPVSLLLGPWHGYRYTDTGEWNAQYPLSMMTLNIQRASGHQRLKATGWNSNGHFDVQGSWTKSEQGILRITLEFLFSAQYSKIYFQGRYDTEQDLLYGNWAKSSDPSNILGLVTFKRNAPEHLRYYPTPSEVHGADGQTRALWRFAILAVRDEVRRRGWSWSYFRERRDQRKTFMRLYPRMFFFGSPLSKSETVELCEVTRTLTSADACYYGSVVRKIRDMTCLHDEICDGCAGRIGGARLVCLDCTPQSQETLDTIDLCDHPSCVSCTVPITRREDLDAPHLPTHHLMKLYTVLHMRQYGRVERAAREALKRVNRWIAAGLGARNQNRAASWHGHGAPGPAGGVRTPMRTTFLPAISVNESGVDGMSVSTPLVESREMFTCGKCHSPVTLPCWYCVVCPDHLFVCSSCDSAGALKIPRSFNLTHDETHPLIRCQEPPKVASVMSTEERLIALEERLQEMEAGQRAVHDRLGDIEDLLRMLQSTLAQARTPSAKNHSTWLNV